VRCLTIKSPSFGVSWDPQAHLLRHRSLNMGRLHARQARPLSLVGNRARISFYEIWVNAMQAFEDVLGCFVLPFYSSLAQNGHMKVRIAYQIDQSCVSIHLNLLMSLHPVPTLERA